MAFFGADLAPDIRQLVEGAASGLSPDWESLMANRLRGLTISHPDWVQESCLRAGMRSAMARLVQRV